MQTCPVIRFRSNPSYTYDQSAAIGSRITMPVRAIVKNPYDANSADFTTTKKSVTVSHEVVIQLIAATTTSTGLKVKARSDTSRYPDKIKVSDAEMALLNLERDPFHGEWNYTLKPRA
jgi:hypothetical protein